MKVKKFVESYKKNNRMDIKNELEVNEYIGIAVKKKMAESIIENCTQIVNGKVYINSLDRYIFFMISVISLHTNLEFDDENVIDDYDLLCKNHLLEKIISLFKDDYDSCQVVLDMETTDMLQSSATIESKIYAFLDDCVNILKNTTEELVKKIDLSSLENANLDNTEIFKLLNIDKN